MCQPGYDVDGLGRLARQLILQQLAVEEKARTDGASGIKQVRQNNAGTRPYFSESHSSDTQVFSVHDHTNHLRTVGLGEFTAVLNGVEFRTRHNDYMLRMPHATSADYHAVQDIPFPPVPPAVEEKATAEEQIDEMRLWFKAWKEQDDSIRDYRQYFKPVLCYLEGGWTTSVDELEEPFSSDRHYLDADTWLDLQEKYRYEAYSGAKDEFENFAYLPTAVWNIVNGSIPVLAQWNYRILCHPLKQDLPLNRFRVVDDVTSRMRKQLTMKELSMTRAAHFQLNPLDTDRWNERESTHIYGLLDELMAEIPGKDNYQGVLSDDNHGLICYDYDTSEELNAAYYHRWYQVQRAGDMGRRTRHRGYSDDNVFMAKTSHSEIAGMDTESCSWETNKTTCGNKEQRWTYAIPLEIIYLTPLHTWNPYNISYRGDADSPTGQVVTKGGRNGGDSAEEAFNGTNSKVFYQAPKSFFVGGEIMTDPADTTENQVAVLDEESNQIQTAASGVRIFFPRIPGVGILRQRYPIMPLHGEGSAVWKELEALKDLVLNPEKNARLFRETQSCSPCQSGTKKVAPVVFILYLASLAAALIVP